MKRNSRVFIIFLVCSFFLRNGPADAGQGLPFDSPNTNISMDFQNANLNDILKILSIQSGLNFISSEAVKDRKITLYLDKVSIREAMDKLFKANNLSYEVDKNSSIFIVKDWGKPQIETQTKVFYLKCATVSSSSLETEKGTQLSSESGTASSTTTTGSEGGITSVVSKNLSEYGKIIEDKRTNSLIVTEIPSRMPIIEHIIISLDLPQPQIMLEVEMLDVSKNSVDKLGVNWPQTLMQFTVPGSVATRFPFGGTGTSGEGYTIDPEKGVFGGPGAGWDIPTWRATDFGPSVLTVIGATLTLDFLRTQSDTKQLARPRILTLNNETAEIKITTQEAISIGSTTVTGSGANAGTSLTNVPVREETGVSLRVTPQVNSATGEITMCILPKVKATTTSGLSTSLNPIKDPEERSTKSIVRIKDGETVVLGGLLRNEFSQAETQLPILGDIPIVGALFRHKNKDRDRERELLVFITPHIVTNGKTELSQMKNTTPLDREQNDMTMFDRVTTMNANLNDFEIKK